MVLELYCQWLFWQSSFLKKVKDWGFTTNPLSTELIGIDQIEKEHKNRELRSSLDYDIDEGI